MHVARDVFEPITDGGIYIGRVIYIYIWMDSSFSRMYRDLRIVLCVFNKHEHYSSIVHGVELQCTCLLNTHRLYTVSFSFWEVCMFSGMVLRTSYFIVVSRTYVNLI